MNDKVNFQQVYIKRKSTVNFQLLTTQTHLMSSFQMQLLEEAAAVSLPPEDTEQMDAPEPTPVQEPTLASEVRESLVINHLKVVFS